jgi:hypothetical protein
MIHAPGLGTQIKGIISVCGNPAGDALDNIDAVSFQGVNLSRVIGNKAYGSHTQVFEHK